MVESPWYALSDFYRTAIIFMVRLEREAQVYGRKNKKYNPTKQKVQFEAW